MRSGIPSKNGIQPTDFKSSQGRVTNGEVGSSIHKFESLGTGGMDSAVDPDGAADM